MPPSPGSVGARQDGRPARDISAEVRVTLRITLGDMALEDAFSVTLPSDGASVPLGDLLARVFPEEPTRRAQVRSTLDVTQNPDVADMYDALHEMFQEWRDRRCSLRFFLNRGPEAGVSEPIRAHLRATGPWQPDGPSPLLLDLVIEHRYTPLDYAVAHGHAYSKARLLDRLQEDALLYLVGWPGGREALDRDLSGGLGPAIDRLVELGRAEPVEGGRVGPSRDGLSYLERLLQEAASYADHYDVFEDVVLGSGPDAVEFGTGRGVDLRVQVYEAEGLDPIRAVFLHQVYDATLDAAADGAPAALDEAFFDLLLAPVVDRDDADPALLDDIIESGFDHLDRLSDRGPGLSG